MEVSNIHLILMALVRGLLVAGAALSIGASGFYWLIFTPALSSMTGQDSSSVRKDGELRARRLAALAAVLIAAASVIALVHEGAMMSGRPVAQVLPVLPAVLLQTHWGAVWIARTVLLAALALALIIRLPLPSVLFISAGAAVTISLVSHAVDAGNISLPVAADAIHITSISLWIGGLVALRVIAGNAVKRFGGFDGKKRFLHETLRRFSRLAVIAVVFVLATGVYSASIHVPGFASIAQTTGYGEILRAKHIFVIATVAMGGVSRVIVLPGLKKAESGERLLRVFWMAIALELVFAALTLACAFLLSQETPPSLG